MVSWNKECAYGDFYCERFEWNSSPRTFRSYSVEALSEALESFPEGGAVVVISHDRSFCEKVGFTHVATVSDGSIRLEQRNTIDSDWKVISTTLDASPNDSLDSNGEQQRTEEADPALRKKLFNAPKRIEKLESLMEKAEIDIAAFDEEMLQNGSDVGKLVELSQKKEALEEQVMEYMTEWEELETLLSQVQQ